MRLVAPEIVLSEAIPGHPAVTVARAWKKLPDQPARYWQADGRTWAAYLPLGGKLSRQAVTSIRRSRSVGLAPLLIARDEQELGAAAGYYMNLRIGVACNVAGKWVLVEPLSKSPCRTPVRKSFATRVSVRSLEDLFQQDELPAYLKTGIGRLLKGYTPLRRKRSGNDAAERAILMTFVSRVLMAMGFCSAHPDAVDVLRRIEQAGWGGSREHFFHSFQNFFLGAKALSRAPRAFTHWQAASRLGWEIDPYAVWLLAALYHDVGHGAQQLDDILSSTLPMEDPTEIADGVRREVLASPLTQEALRQIASLAVRLLEPHKARSTWIPPSPRAKRTSEEKRAEDALVRNFMWRHGASGALILYRQMSPTVERMGAGMRDVLKQTVLMACVSIPFHDWHFRQCLREEYGSFRMPTEVMPYAATLAFVDSIQDDRRELAPGGTWLRFLEELNVAKPPKVTAKLNLDAMQNSDVLWKAVEGRDVLAHLAQSPDKLNFEYPAWMGS